MVKTYTGNFRKRKASAPLGMGVGNLNMPMPNNQFAKSTQQTRYPKKGGKNTHINTRK
jgi:hypothetical protein